jgi:hypothetical protein
MNEENIMFKLKPSFQKEVFEDLIKKYKGSIDAGKHLQIPASSIRGYKNLYFDSVPKKIIECLVKLKIINPSKLNKNTIRILTKTEIIQKSLDFGREKRNKKLLRLRKEIPLLKAIVKTNKINLVLWLNKHLLLANSGFRKIFVKEESDHLLLTYNNFTKLGFKNFRTKLPKSFEINEEFLYFFGLWCGDRSGGKRFGICNQNKRIIQFTKKFLGQNYQKVEKILYISKKIEEPDINYDKKFYINKKGSWVLSTHSNNGFLASFFYYLQSNLEEFLKLIKNQYPFFAGLFDAEGNVSLYNKSFRWACKNEELINIYSEHLKKMRLYARYDGSCLVSYNRKVFYKKIFPYLKHSEKIKLSSFLCTGKGNLPKDYGVILNYIKKNPNKTAKEITKALKKNKVYSELRLLKEFGFIFHESYPYKFRLNNKRIISQGV